MSSSPFSLSRAASLLQIPVAVMIGKIAVPDAVLLNEGQLDPQESRVMRKHPIDRGARPAEEAFQLLADESSKGWRDRALVDTFANLITATPA
jgi:hypothetical protein